ncbi:MAG: undecaprenyl-diphosphate phosphatase [Eubacteriales bacterium]
MNIIESIIIGLVQGLTEFLPVSSSGHIVLLQNVFGIQEQQIFFGVMVHLATLVAVTIVLWKDILKILKNLFGHMTWMIVIASIPAVIIGALFSDFFEEAFGGASLGYMFLLTALILTLSEKLYSRQRKNPRQEVNLKNALSMGIMQALAILPGVSRSGSTIAGGLFTGMNREAAAKFSFLMSIPIILGSAIFEGYDAVKVGIGNVDWLPVILGMVAACISGYVAVKFMLNLIKRKRLYGFAVYVGILGALVILDQLVFHVFF